MPLYQTKLIIRYIVYTILYQTKLSFVNVRLVAMY